jgi:hypothetical protein
MDRPFISGLELSELLYREAVQPLLVRTFAKLNYSAALIGTGSDVLGFDTPQSRDHDWGPRLMLFLSEADHKRLAKRIDQTLRKELPTEVHGYPTNFGEHPDATGGIMLATEGGPINHRVQLLTVSGYFHDVLGFDPLGEIRAVDWLSVPEQSLLSLASGRVFHDGLDQLEPIRARLSYYPRDVWLYLLACQWRRIDQEEPFMGRTGQVGDDLGSRWIAARLVHDLMKLCFLMERRYAPYVKWFGSAFAQLECGKTLDPILTRVLQADSWQQRERPLSAAYEFVARKHNKLGITDPLPTQVSHFHERPFNVLHSSRFVEAIRGAIQDPEVLALPEHLGAVDQFVDSTDALNDAARFKVLYAQP